jgi:hypothetical protein
MRRLLSQKISVAAMLELVLWLGIPYVIIGVTWAFFNPEPIEQHQVELQAIIPGGIDLLAFAEAALLWPVLMIAPGICAI